uniref:Small ribosomal subunit protein bS16c n=1 Tax=Athyrium anisopterum TaxID=2023749 RepID=A0A222YUJ6_9MONI|nr:ribosomal protein S16 [Athyrium anisopterum]YP_010885981.1 ribosomal protein S16 [Athyrium deltoidofrons]YP_010886337.1 ribosomal protein S16 [Athyrium spinulosum]YP_010886426.1 ribosomal protein S16 [Athyrium vidalii]ASR74991.1 ribosomal protein S16 [Athyrium anisopterum]WJH16224.1 ribosomal protein S16 [Athyrium deltoidofrons]WJH16577.1 ribosomal protein S16 [Athyrium spinulosum]WJH16669.1 ribosomal protein S16 [Athyrium vidalii]
MVKPRLKRHGKKRRVTYRIIAIDTQSRREGEAIREVGFYNPRKEQTQLDLSAIIALLKEGAQSTETVRDISKRAKVPEQVGINLQSKIKF